MVKEKIKQKKLNFFPPIGVIKKGSKAFFFTLSLLFFLLSCEQPFKAGLGPPIDLQAPTIVLVSPEAGAYIRGFTKFTGTAEDDIKLDSVSFQISNYPDVELSEYKSFNHKLGKFYRMTEVAGEGRNYNWTFRIDTQKLNGEDKRVFPDGDFKIRLMVKDAKGKEAVTDEIAFFIKNDIPQISMAFPSIVEGDENGDLGSPHLNYGYNPADPEKSDVYQRVLDVNSRMVGMITDSEGIYRGVENKEEGIYPPQIRFWEVSFSNKKDLSAEIPVFPYGELPGENELWQNLGRVRGVEGVGDLMEIGVGSLQFTYRVPDETGKFYGFQIRAQSSDSMHTSALYPRDWYNFEGKDEGYKNENSFVLITLREPLEYPTLELYALEDILLDPAPRREAGVMKYRDIEMPEQDKLDGNYPYITRTVASRKGPFTLRVKAYHSGGIKEAWAYWEKEDKSAKGRFIWDPVNVAPRPGWNESNLISGTKSYETWGFIEPDLSPYVRSFIFTHNGDPAKDKIPDTDKFPEYRGRSKVQRYVGEPTNELDRLPADKSNWEDYVLEEGTYNITVYATSSSGTRIAAPLTVTISIDKEGPRLELVKIEGSRGGDNGGAYIVNGVIRPRFLLSDSRPLDTGIRAASSKYFEVDGRLRMEQAYVLVAENQKAAMDSYLTNNPCPSFPNIQGGNLAIPGVAISKHGPIVDSVCLFKTSNNYSETREPLEDDALADGDYRLYVIGRDNAFNAGWASYPLRVEFKSDEPVFNFLDSVDENVDEPDYTFDDPNSDKSFISKAGGRTVIRNIFTAGRNIRVKIDDDDSLDLGTRTEGSYPAADSGVTVTITGSRNVNGKTVAKDASYSAKLSDDDIKNAFTPQTLLRDSQTNAVITNADNTPVRNKATSITGTITQTMLLDALKNQENENLDKGLVSLPDGIYRVDITAKDYNDKTSKLVKPDNANKALVKTAKESFWIAVDSKAPLVTNVEPPTGSYISPKDQVDLKGIVSDENGPITVTGWTVTGNDKTSSSTAVNNDLPGLELKTLNETARPSDTEALWKYSFSFPIITRGITGSFTFEIKFQDRFGNVTTLTQKYSVDNEPPKVALTKPIETFSRKADDVSLNGHTQLDATTAGIDFNKGRLAVKVVSFTINVTDNFKVGGVRWWLLPADVNSTVTGLSSTAFIETPLKKLGGQVTDYNAFPANAVQEKFPMAQGGVYYGTTDTSDANYIQGFDKGAYGVVDVENRKFTVTVDSEKLKSANGEYRLHIIAIDEAGNVSRMTEDVNKNPTSSLYQTVFFLQEEDKPYFERNITPNSVQGKLSVVGANSMIVRGNILENNGFFANQEENSLLDDSILIWFSDLKDAETDEQNLNGIIAADNSITGYEGPKKITTGLGRSGRNLSLNIDLKEYFSGKLENDGTKHYIIKATDSPVNKLKADGTAALAPGDNGLRVSRLKHFSFVYDAVPPVIKITGPQQGKPFGTDSFGKEFLLQGNMTDVNLVTYEESGKYYFEYYLDNNNTPEGRKKFPLDPTQHYEKPEETDAQGAVTVYFKIPPNAVAADIIPNFSALEDGAHTLTLVAIDKSGKESSAVYNFVKDVTPPVISFSNIEDSLYNEENRSNVSIGWWKMSASDRLKWLNENALSTISYSTGVPSLKGSFIDAVSGIAVAVNVLQDGRNINYYAPSSGTFRYWIDYDKTATPPNLDTGARDHAVIDGSGGNVRWEIYLTDTGFINGNPLPDGVHTIMLEVADTSGVKNEGRYVIAFRIDSKPPTAAIIEPQHSVFGPAARQGDPVFTVSGTAYDANLKDLKLRIVDKAAGKDLITVNFSGDQEIDQGTAAGIAAGVWAYVPFNSTAPAPDPKEDNVKLSWSYGVAKADFAKFAPGGSYDLIAVASDYYGNLSEPLAWTFTVDTGSPEIIFTNPEKSEADGSLKPENLISHNARVPMLLENASLVTSENLRILGRVRDAASAIKQAQSIVWKWDWISGEWKIIEGWKDVQDFNDNRSNEVNWAKNLLGQNPGDFDLVTMSTAANARTDFSQETLSKAEGLYRVQIRAKDEAFTETGTMVWDPDTDRGNPAWSQFLYFYYDRGVPELTMDAAADKLYSTAVFGKDLNLKGTVADKNRFARLDVAVERADDKFAAPPSPKQGTVTRTSAAALVTDINQGDEKQNWTALIQGLDELPDGRYKITATVYDMAGRASSVQSSFTLDNTSPGMRFTSPAKEPSKYQGHGVDSDRSGFASMVVYGGETAVITGEAWDKSDFSSESGVEQMWYRLGFLDNNTSFPTKELVADDANELITKARTGANANKTDKELMDIVSEENGNAWFKLGGTEIPKGFIINNANIYDWRMEIPSTHPTLGPIGGLKLYGSDIIIKGRQYKVVRALVPDNYEFQMARAVPPAQAGNFPGVYRLPLWVRLADKAGNVGYYCHDIFFYPDGDIPTTSIQNPENNSTMNSARGGIISVDGEARSNTSVYDVVFRVFADNVHDTDLDGDDPDKPENGKEKTGTLPAPSKVVKLPLALRELYPPVRTDGEVYKIIKDVAYNTTDEGDISHWYGASLTLKGGAGEPVMPWNIILNSTGELTALLKERGFSSADPSDTDPGHNDMLRIWLEVFVFNGEEKPIRSSIYRDDGKGTGGGALYGFNNPDSKQGPKPYVRCFYLKTTSAAITHPHVAGWNNGTNANPNLNFSWKPDDPGNPGGGGYKGAGTELQRQRFAVRAILDPNPGNSVGSGLGEVLYRTKLNNDSYSGWTQVWKSNIKGAVPIPLTHNPALPVNLNGASIQAVTATDNNRTRYNFIYAIDSQAPGDINTFASLGSGKWKDSGGTLTVQIRIRDNADPPNEAEQTIVVSVDNFTPVADPDYVSNPKAAGTSVTFVGRVYDYATAPPANSMASEHSPRKIDRIIVWFMKGGQYVHMTDKLTTSFTGLPTMNAVSGRTISAPKGSNDVVNAITVNNPGEYPAPVPYPTNDGYVRTISETTAQPATGMFFSPTGAKDDDIRWSLTLDSTKLPDGDIKLCYLVVDGAGNAGYYEQTISVRNNYPEIESITLYTNNEGTGAAYTASSQQRYVINDYRGTMYTNNVSKDKVNTTGYLNSGFISKNRYLGFKAETLRGNRNLNFRLQHVTRERVVLTKDRLTQMVADRNLAATDNVNLYTIAWHGNYTSANWKQLGVIADEPVIGSHFVLTMSEVPKDYEDMTAEVWKYTIRMRLNNYVPTGQSAQDMVAAGPATNFQFNGTTHFTGTKPTADNGQSGIAAYNGSHPDDGDLQKDDPDNTAFFLVRVWDTLNPPANNNSETWVNNQLYDAVVIGANVYLEDTTPPVARIYDLNPYTELTARDSAASPQAVGSNIVRGGLWNAGTDKQLLRSGYIDPRDKSTALAPVNSRAMPLPDYPNLNPDDKVGTGTARDKVSGTVILRGIAWDDQLINEVKIKIGGDAEKVILRLQNGKMVTVPSNSNTIFVIEELHWKTGHTVEWAYVWNTQTEPVRTGQNPVNNIEIRVSVTDRRSPANTSESVSVTEETNAKFHNRVSVDIVPFITGFERDARFATRRSLQGWYSFYRGEQNIKVNGYNFGTSGSVSMTLNGQSVGTVNRTSTNLCTFNIPDNASSGALVLTSTFEAYNSQCVLANRSWNREYHMYTPGSDLWTVKRYAHIWRTGEVTTGNAVTKISNTGITQSMEIKGPSMSLQWTGSSVGRLHLAWKEKGMMSDGLYNMTLYGDNSGNTRFLNRYGTSEFSADEAFITDSADIDYWNDSGYQDNLRLNASVLATGTRWETNPPQYGITINDRWRSTFWLYPRILNTFNAGNSGSVDTFNNTYRLYLHKRRQDNRNRGGGNVAEQFPYKWENLRIKKLGQSDDNNGNPGKILVSAYDAINDRLLVTGGNDLNYNADTRQDHNPRASDNADHEVYITADPTGLDVHRVKTSQTFENSEFSLDVYNEGNIFNTLKNQGGEWSAVDYDSYGRPVVVYFAKGYSGTPTLVLAFGPNPVTTLNQTFGNFEDRPTYSNTAYGIQNASGWMNSATFWKYRFVLPPGPLRSGSGQYVSMKIERQVEAGTGNETQGDSDKIHLAFYNSRHMVMVYAVGTLKGEFKAYVIDRVVEGGKYTDISVDKNGCPWIVYADTERAGNRDGARIAYLSSGSGQTFTRPLKDPISGNFITGWEAVTMPGDYMVNSDRLNIEAWPPKGYTGSNTSSSPLGNWHAAVGYASDAYRIGYFFRPTVPSDQ